MVKTRKDIWRSVGMEPFKEKVWLARPLMHEEEQDFIKLAFDENYITTGGTNLYMIER